MMMNMKLLLLAALVTAGCKTPSSDGSKLRDATPIDKEDLPPVRLAFWADKDFVYRGFCSWSTAPFNRGNCTDDMVRVPASKFNEYFKRLEMMPDGYSNTGDAPTGTEVQKATAELLSALQNRDDLAWIPMQRRVSDDLRQQIKLSDGALQLASRLNQFFLGMGQTRAVMPPFMVSIFELTGRGAIKIGLRNGLKKDQSVIVQDGKALREGTGFFDLFKEIAAEQDGRKAICQLYNNGKDALPAKTILFVSGWDRFNPDHSDVTSFRLYKDAELTKETGYMSCVGAFTEFKGKPLPSFPLGELLTTFKDQSDFILQGYME
jgi:hypothetical protein